MVSKVFRRPVRVAERERGRERIPGGSSGGGHVTGGRMTDMACRGLWPWTRGFPRAPGVLEREAPNVQSWHLLHELMSSVRSHSDWSDRFSPSIIPVLVLFYFFSFFFLFFFLFSFSSSGLNSNGDLEPWRWAAFNRIVANFRDEPWCPSCGQHCCGFKGEGTPRRLNNSVVSGFQLVSSFTRRSCVADHRARSCKSTYISGGKIRR